MSCLVGIEHNGKVYIGADSAASSDEEIRIRRDQKLFRNDYLIIGACGSIRILQCLKEGLWKPSRDLNSIEEIVEMMRLHLIDMNTITNTEGVDSFESNLLIGYDGKLYEILTDFQIAEAVEGYTSNGGGKCYALGSLYETAKLKIKPEERIMRALEVAEFFCPSVRSPFVVYDL